jgi:hypothetical protein
MTTHPANDGAFEWSFQYRDSGQRAERSADGRKLPHLKYRKKMNRRRLALKIKPYLPQPYL